MRQRISDARNQCEVGKAIKTEANCRRSHRVRRISLCEAAILQTSLYERTA
jgi:hypothetical protein